MTSLGQHPEPRFTIAHVSDPHLLAGSLQFDAIDTDARFRSALERLQQMRPSPQAIVFTGDLADRAEPAAYARLRELVEPVAADLGAQVVWVMGNHDERAVYARELYGVDSDAPQDRVHDVAGLRIVALDSTVPGYHHGALTDEQLAWLGDVLAEPAPYGTLLALHHPPLPIPMLPAAQLIELDDQQRLAEVVAGSDVRGIIAGHLHFTTWSTFAGIPVSVAGATCNLAVPSPAGRLVSTTDSDQSFVMIHVYDDCVVHTLVPVASATEVSGHSSDLLPALLALSPTERRDLVSRKDSPLNTGELSID